MIETRPHLPTTIAANIEHFTGRTWLLPALLEWLEKSDKRMFILTGGPGTGKSMIMAWLAGAGPSPTDTAARSQLERIRSRVKATHFCIAASGTIAPKAIAQNVAEQLTRSVKGFGDALVATLSDRVQISTVQQIGRVEAGGSATGVYIGRLDLGTLGDELSFDRTLRDPLQKLYQGGYKEPMLLLVDALDEAQTYTGSISLIELLEKLAYLPRQVRMLATTRPDPRVLKCFREVKPFDLISDAPSDADDIRLYVDERLTLSTPAIDHEKRVLLGKRISEAAKGIFLYAYMVLGDLLPRLPNVFDLETYPLPGGLSGLYHDFLNRELGRDEDRWYETFKPVLGLIAVAQGEGLTEMQLQQISGKELEQTIRICKQYLAGDLPEGPFRIFHKSFADFLLDEKENIDYHIDGTSMHRKIVDYYREKAPSGENVDWWNVDEYGLLHLTGHLYALREVPEYRSQFYGLICKPFMEKKLSYFQSPHSFSRDVDLVIQVAADDESAEGLVHLVRGCLIYATLGTRATQVPPEVLGILAQEGEVARALGYAGLIQDKAKQSEAYLRIGQALLIQGKNKNEEEKQAINQALAAAEAIQNEWHKASALSAVAQAMAQAGDKEGLHRALAAAEAIEDEEDKASALSGVAQAMAQAGQHTKALQVLRNAFWTSRLAGRKTFFRVLENGAEPLAAVDRGKTLWKMYEAMQEVDGWWSAS